jgi:hypothetical protein
MGGCTDFCAISYLIVSQRNRGFGSLQTVEAEDRVVGILVHGDNHFIVRGPLPDREMALALARHWSLIQIGRTTPAALQAWSIVTREFRENLEWAVVVPDDEKTSPAVAQLLTELAARGIAIHTHLP